MANPIVTSLPAYVKQNTGLIMGASVLGAKTAKMFTGQSGVKGSSAINLLNTDIKFGAGACGWNPDGTATLSQREIETGLVDINMPFCEKELVGKWAERDLKIKAGLETLPFEDMFVDSVAEGVNVALDKAIWQGDKSSQDGNLNKFDGMLKILNADVPSANKKTIATTESYYSAVKKMLLAIPAQALKNDTIIACSYDFLRGYAQDLVEKNLFHYDSSADLEEIAIPASGVKLVAFAGLEGANKLVAGRLSNFYYGYDFEDAPTSPIFWYSQDNREFRLAIEFNAGTQVAIPDEVVLGTYTTLQSL